LLANQEWWGDGEVEYRVGDDGGIKEVKEKFGPTPQPLLHIFCCVSNQRRKQLKMDDSLKQLQPADPPNTATKSIISTSMAITTKFSTADFSQPIQFPSLR
jgi:hypothetical protein